MAKAVKDDSISVLEVSTGTVEFCVLGTSPLIMNRMAAKAKRELLLPKGRKTLADRAATLKHNPLAEYRDAAYRVPGDTAPTALCFFATGFKGALASAALDVPGAKKTEIGRLCRIEGVDLPIWGVPKLMMSVVRSADINRTPDVRTRPILPEWACRVAIRFVKPKLNVQAVSNLLAWAGETIGIGDFRQEKGKGSYGLFRLVPQDDPDFVGIVAEQGRAAQEAALAEPEPFDADTEELLDWYNNELKRTGRAA